MVLALVPFTWVAYHYADLPQFGKYQDDGLLLIGGKSLHDSAGYRIANLPGKPYQTKYQPLYPALLSLVWVADAKFPENLRILSFLQWLIVIGWLAASFALFRSAGFAAWKCAAMVVFLASCPWLVYWALLPTADIIFSLLVAGLFLLLRQHRDDSRWWWVIGGIGAAACLTKVAAILIVPAIWAGGWRPAQWKRSLAITLPMLAAFTGWTLWAALQRAPGANSVLWYYTDYVAFDIKNGGLAALPQIVESNLGSLLATVGNCFFFDLANSLPGRFLAVIILAAWISGVRRMVKRAVAVEYAVFCILLVLLLLVWNFSPNARLLAPALPLLAMGLCAEAEHLAGLIQRAARSLKKADRIAAPVVGAGVAAGWAAALLLNLNFIAHGIPALLDRDRSALARDRNTFEWCKRSLPASSVILANNDTYLYLATGLTSVRAVPSSVAIYKRGEAAELDNFMQVGPLVDFFGITHILITPDDFEPAQRPLVLHALSGNPRLRRVHSPNESVLFEVGEPAAGRLR
jgi:hypothetical protein